MRLLNTSTLILHDFFEPYPDYVILSHMWGEDEVTFDDIHKPHARQMQGYRKIAGCCQMALKDGFEWAWIDTCCIDKRSSSELSEAINSMYEWYWSAAICYAYMSDVHHHHEIMDIQMELEASRWFHRGWTLQELLAPDVVEFYDKSWKFLGTKSQLIQSVERATNINEMYLSDRDTIKSASIATKLSWAAGRQTTRPEDIAYCLLGLVEVNMPMLYGEGDRAFYRLQSELIRKDIDHTIFTWEPIEEDWESVAVLAPSPALFKGSANNSRIEAQGPSSYDITNNGLRITLPCITIGQDRIIGILNCGSEDTARFGLWLENVDNNRYQRLPNSKLATLTLEDVEEAELRNLYLVASNPRKKEQSQTKSHLMIGDIYADRYCCINGISVSRPGHNEIIKEPRVLRMRRDYEDDSLHEQSRFLFNSSSIFEGESACIRIGYKRESGFSYIYLSMGLHKGRAVVHTRGASRYDTLLADYAARELEENLSRSRSYGDLYAKRIWGWISIHVDAKKQRRNGQMRWILYVRIFQCQCIEPGGPKWTEAVDEAECLCPWKDQKLMSVKCAVSQLGQDERKPFKGCHCSICGDVSNENQEDKHPNRCPCQTCTREREPEQAVKGAYRRGSIQHTDDEYENDKRSAGVPRNDPLWSHWLQKLGPRKRRSTEF